MEEIESWQNGKFIPNSQIGTKLWDAHYFFGFAVFDAFRTYNHIPHMLNCHINRLYNSAKMAGIDIPIDKIEMVQRVHDVIDHNKQFFPKDEEFRFMIFVSPGYFKIYDDMGKCEPIVTINVTTCSRYAKHVYPYLSKGYTGLISSQPQIPSRFLDPKIKSCSRLHYGIADNEAKTYGIWTQPILLDEHGFITESSGSNFGFFKDDKICLPRDNNILRGCTMQFIEQTVFGNLDVVKDNWEPYDIVNADFAFFTSTFLGLVPCYEIIYRNRKHKLENKKKLMEEMMKKYGNVLGLNVNKQWKEWYETKR